MADYDGAIEAGNAVLAEAHTEIGRKAEVGETSRLYARLAYCLLKLEQIDKAVLRLEEGKARLLTEALALADADLDMLSGMQRQAMLETRESVRSLEAEMRLAPDAPDRRSDVELGRLLCQRRIDLKALVGTRAAPLICCWSSTFAASGRAIRLVLSSSETCLFELTTFCLILPIYPRFKGVNKDIRAF